MATCKDCLHIGICPNLNHDTVADKCPDFKDRSRFVELPCKQHDILWTYCTWPRTKIYSFCVTNVSYLNGGVHINTDTRGVIRGEDVGKTVFLTREEAEAKLSKMDGGESNE